MKEEYSVSSLAKIETPISDVLQVGDKHITVQDIFDYVPSTYGWWYENYMFDPDFDSI
jgi:hypothetical protein